MSEFSRELNRWYFKNARDLPWRETKDPYKIWISEIMLQQTTVKAVIPYYERWTKKFPNVHSAAKAEEQQILNLWQGLGYYSRAKNIHKAAKYIVDHFNGKVPSKREELKELPGFGPYTIGALLSIAFDKREPIIDANVRRVVMRVLAIKGKADLKNDQTIYKFLDQVMPKKNNRTFNQALMELGALICRNKEPLCLLCPVKEKCLAYKKGIQEIIPDKQSKTIKNIDAVIGIIKKRNKFYIQQRPSKGLLADLWEFPGGKLEANETHPGALSRELREEIGVNVRGHKHMMNVKHYYTQFRVNLWVAFCVIENDPPVDERHKWVSLKELSRYPMPSGSAKIVEKLQSSLTSVSHK